MIYILYLLIFLLFFTGIYLLFLEKFVVAVCLLMLGVAKVLYLLISHHNEAVFALTIVNSSLAEYFIIFLLLNISLALFLHFKDE